ncbi:MAG: SWIM zinc finger family protein, partial [Myxococcales bacterium]
AYVQAGRAVFDLHRGVYRARELSRDPLPVEKLRFRDEREAEAARLVRGVRDRQASLTPEGALRLSGKVPTRSGGECTPSLLIDGDLRIVEASCSCSHYQNFKLTRGPCEHMLALRLSHHAS